MNGEELEFINSADSWGRTPLHAAATTETSQCLRILVQAGSDINAPCGPRGECRTPLHIAAEHGNVQNVQVSNFVYYCLCRAIEQKGYKVCTDFKKTTPKFILCF